MLCGTLIKWYTDADIRRILGCLNEPMNVRLSKLNNFYGAEHGSSKTKRR